MKEKFVIRLAGESDIDGIIPVWKEFIELHTNIEPRLGKKPKAEPVFREILAEMIHAGDSGVYIAETDNGIAGFILMTLKKDEPTFADSEFGYIDIIAVSEKWRRHGTGKLLYEKAEQWFRDKGVTHIELYIVPSNPQASSFWMKMGYSPYLSLLYKKI